MYSSCSIDINEMIENRNKPAKQNRNNKIINNTERVLAKREFGNESPK